VGRVRVIPRVVHAKILFMICTCFLNIGATETILSGSVHRNERPIDDMR
jgi:hypothetical protein